MANCIFCNDDVEKPTIGVNIRSLHIPRTEIDALMKVCPSCGGLQLVGNSYLELMSDGFPEVTDADLAGIDLDTLFDEMALPGRDTGEEVKWIDPSDLDDHPLNQFYEDKFQAGISTWAKTKRLVHFLKMDSTERKNAFGDFRCPSMRIVPGGDVVFREGRTRFFLFKYMGASRIPVSIAPEFQSNAEEAGITLHDSKE